MATDREKYAKLSFSEISPSLERHSEFISQFESVLYDATIAWYRKNMQVPDTDAEGMKSYFLGKHSPALAEARRKYINEFVDLTARQFESIKLVISQYICINDLYPTLNDDFAAYDLVNRIFDGRSHKGRGPKSISHAHSSKYFWEIWDSFKASGALTNKYTFRDFVINSIPIKRQAGDFSSAIRNARVIAWMLVNSRQKDFAKYSDIDWAFLLGLTVRHGFYAAQQCEDYYNINIFLQYAETAERYSQEKFLMMARQFMNMHMYGLSMDLGKQWQSNYGLNGYLLSESSKYETGAFDDYLKGDITRFVNSAIELARNGRDVNEKLEIYGRSSIISVLERASQENDVESHYAIEGKILASANYAEVLAISGNFSEAEKIAHSAISLAYTQDDLSLAKARIFETLGLIEVHTSPNTAATFLKKARDIYASIGSLRRAARLSKKMI